MSFLKNCAWIFALSIMVSGCATNRGILDVQVAVPDNSSSGPWVKIGSVTDSREFQASPRKPSIPSLKGREINDTSITSRAVARKRNGYGMALGDILLPEGRTVEDLTRDALTRSFREAGYRVIDDEAGGGENVIEVDADIEQFWAWFTPGFWAAKLDFEARVKITGDVGSFQGGELVNGQLRLKTMAAGTKAWRNILTEGIDVFIQEVKQRLTNEQPKTQSPDA